MFRSLKLGQAFGIDIYVHWTFIFVFLYVFAETAGAGMPIVAFSLLLACAVFGCVVLHELGHALAARHFGIGTRDITLYPIGGVARLDRMSERPWEEFCIAIAGPAVNVAIALFLTLNLAVFGEVYNLDTLLFESYSIEQFSRTLMLANWLLVLFNLVPAFPMDGGRVFRAVLSQWLGHFRATEIAAGLGSIIGVAMAFYGLYIGAWGLALIGGFVFLAAQQERAAVRYREMFRYFRNAQPFQDQPRGPNVVDAEVIDEPRSQSVTSAFSGYTWDGSHQKWVYWKDGRPVRTISVD